MSNRDINMKGQGNVMSVPRVRSTGHLSHFCLFGRLCQEGGNRGEVSWEENGEKELADQISGNNAMSTLPALTIQASGSTSTPPSSEATEPLLANELQFRKHGWTPLS